MYIQDNGAGDLGELELGWRSHPTSSAESVRDSILTDSVAVLRLVWELEKWNHQRSSNGDAG